MTIFAVASLRAALRPGESVSLPRTTLSAGVTSLCFIQPAVSSGPVLGHPIHGGSPPCSASRTRTAPQADGSSRNDPPQQSLEPVQGSSGSSAPTDGEYLQALQVARLKSRDVTCLRRHLGWWSDLVVRLGVGDAVRGFFGGSGQRSHAELKRSAPARRPQGGMVYRVGVGLATRASGARCRPGPGDQWHFVSCGSGVRFFRSSQTVDSRPVQLFSPESQKGG